MERFKFLGMIGSVCLGAAGVLLAPDVAKAGCCPSNWSTTINDGGQSAECDVIVGGGRVDGRNWVVKPFASPIDREDAFVEIQAAPGAYSPAIRMEFQCSGPGIGPQTTPWLELTPGGDPYHAPPCFAGVNFSHCQTRLADNTFCTGSCS